jgi:hypothetical protein
MPKVKHLLAYARDAQIDVPLDHASIRESLLELAEKKIIDPFLDVAPY